MDPLYVINMCCYEKASECYISQSLMEAEIVSCWWLGCLKKKVRWLIKGPSVVGKDMENFKNMTMDTVSG